MSGSILKLGKFVFRQVATESISTLMILYEIRIESRLERWITKKFYAIAHLSSRFIFRLSRIGLQANDLMKILIPPGVQLAD